VLGQEGDQESHVPLLHRTSSCNRETCSSIQTWLRPPATYPPLHLQSHREILQTYLNFHIVFSTFEPSPKSFHLLFSISIMDYRLIYFLSFSSQQRKYWTAQAGLRQHSEESDVQTPHFKDWQVVDLRLLVFRNKRSRMGKPEQSTDAKCAGSSAW
jgi:hypothetical protein